MPHTLKMFEQAKLMGSSTHSIPPLAYENNFGYGRTHYYQSLLLGNEYKGGGRGIRILMRLENEVMYSKRKEDGVGAMGKSRKGMRLRTVEMASRSPHYAVTTTPATGSHITPTASNAQVIFDKKKLGNSYEVSLDDSLRTI
ncbi:hypothetical protein Tco_1501311 [Tanacetum coccineum]